MQTVHSADGRVGNVGIHAPRSFTLGEIIVAAIQAAGAIVLRAHAHHRERQLARATCDALRQLDDHTLRDLGFDRSEIVSVAAEITGATECTRVRAARMSQGYCAFLEREPA